jgi:hypothetical protein
MRRHVLIDQTAALHTASPFDSEAEANAALRQRIKEHVANPDHFYDAAYVADFLNGSDADNASDDELNEAFGDLSVAPEGSRGVWTNFDSADRCAIFGAWPEEQEHGSGDSYRYPTTHTPSGGTTTVLHPQA